MFKVNPDKSRVEKLSPPGTIYHMYKVDPLKTDITVEESFPENFMEVVISTEMFVDHMPTKYEEAFQTLLNIEDWTCIL